MGHSSLLGIEPAAAEPDGRSADLLGPSDSSDSGSDTVGTPPARGDGAASDSAGTGERRGAGRDKAQPEAPDIAADRVYSVGPEGTPPPSDDGLPLDEDEDPDLAFIDQARADDIPDPDDDRPGEDEPEDDRPGEDRPYDDKPVSDKA
jgi:hypothetical protein